MVPIIGRDEGIFGLLGFLEQGKPIFAAPAGGESKKECLYANQREERGERLSILIHDGCRCNLHEMQRAAVSDGLVNFNVYLICNRLIRFPRLCQPHPPNQNHPPRNQKATPEWGASSLRMIFSVSGGIP